MLAVVGGTFERPDVGTEGGLSVGEVFLGEESGIVFGVSGTRSLDARVDGSGDCGELGSNSCLVGGYRRGSCYGTESA